MQLRETQRVVGLFTDADQLPAARHRQTWWWSALQQAPRTRLRVKASDSALSVRDARTSIRKLQWRDAWIAAGDAAWSLDPLSGTGLQRALGDGKAIGALLADHPPEAWPEQLREHVRLRVDSMAAALESQRGLYAQEYRWPDAPFWRRRRARLNLDARAQRTVNARARQR